MAKLVLVEFSDYECPFCARHATNVLPEIKTRWIAPGRLRYVFANLPLPSHPDAVALARSALCAEKQGMYWQMHDAIFAASRPVPKSETGAFVSSLLPALNMNVDAFGRCMSDADASQARIDRDVQYARTIGIAATPGFALGYRTDGGLVNVTTIIKGAQPLAVFDSALSAAEKGGAQRWDLAGWLSRVF